MSFHSWSLLLVLVVSESLGVLSISVIDTPLHVCCQIQTHMTQSNLVSLDCENENRGRAEVFRRPSPYIWSAPSSIVDSPQGLGDSVNFRLLERNMTCNTGHTTITILTNETEPNKKFLLNGYFKENSESYHTNEYCLNKFNSSVIEIKACQPNCPSLKKGDVNENSISNKHGGNEERTSVCIRKCCTPDKTLYFLKTEDSRTNFKCNFTHVNFVPKIYSEDNKLLSKSKRENTDLHIRRVKPACLDGGGLQFFALDSKVAKAHKLHHLCFRIHSDGRGYFKNENRRWELARDFCIDTVENFFDKVSPRSGSSYENELGVIMCSRPPQDQSTVAKTDQRRKLYGGMMISSSIFLLFTFVVYALLWDQRGLHGWTTMGHSASMFFMYIFLGTAHMLPATEGEEILNKFSCVITGVLAHFFFISAFCWLTLICFDLWFTFKSFSPKSSRSKGVTRFVYYVFFGWGVPTAVIIVSLVLDAYSDELQCGNIVFPSYGQRVCYVAEETLAEYVYYPIAALLILNLVLFSVTTWKIYEYKKSTRMATSNMENNQQFFKLCIKLFFVMGFSWIFEIISWAHVGAATPWYWTILDCVNLFQALAIFIIYVCKKETILALEKKYPCLKPVLLPLITLFKWKQTSLDQEQSSTLNTSSQRSNERTRESALSDDSIRISSMYTPRKT